MDLINPWLQVAANFEELQKLCACCSCSQCDFTSQFESALLMHHQLHHDTSDSFPVLDTPKVLSEKSNTLPRISPPSSPFNEHKSKAFKLASRTSATRIFDKLRARLSRSRTLFSHPESRETPFNAGDLSVPSECTSKALKVDSLPMTCLEEKRETYGCHLCPFDADRITVLDRHLLNHHKIGLESLLKLVMAKTKDGLSEDNTQVFGIRQPYYRLHDEVFEEGEFIIETVAPKIKILKHTSTNTEDFGFTIQNNYRSIAGEIENFMKGKGEDTDFMSKMVTLNECMCKFVASSNALKKVVNKELDSKVNVRDSVREPAFNLSLIRSEKEKMSAESFYF